MFSLSSVTCGDISWQASLALHPTLINESWHASLSSLANISRLYKLGGAQRVNGGFMTHLTPGDAIQVNVPVNITISTVSCRLDNVSVRSTNLYVRYHKSFSFLFSFLRSIWWLRSLTFSRVETDHNWYVTQCDTCRGHGADVEIELRLGAFSSPHHKILPRVFNKNKKFIRK